MSLPIGVKVHVLKCHYTNCYLDTDTPLPNMLPTYETLNSAGVDVRANIENRINIFPGCRALIPTGLVVGIPSGYEIQVRPRSGLALKSGITVLNSPGTIDSDYRGEIGVMLINLGEAFVSIAPGDRIAQLVLCPVMQIYWQPMLSVDALGVTTRGDGGFGHTGDK